MSLRLECVTCVRKILEEHVFFKACKQNFRPQDLPFANFLILTALRRKAVLDKVFAKLIRKKIPHKNRILNDVLLLGATEILYMKTPDFAVINEYVQIAKRLTDRFAAGMVNAVLRQIAAQKDVLKNGVCFPASFKQMLEKDYDTAQLKRMEEMLLFEAPVDLTVTDNPLSWKNQSDIIVFENGTVRLTDTQKNVTHMEGFDEGGWFVQDLAASLPVGLLGDVQNKKVLDLCAAPGGKTAQLLARGAIVKALDVSSERLKTLQDNIERLKLKQNLKIECADAVDFLENNSEMFDVILLDAPCSATGTYRKHPEVLYLKTTEDVAGRLMLQKKLLNAAASHVHPGGILVYCTCSLAKDEGEGQVEAFLKTHSDFVLEPLQVSRLKKYEAKTVAPYLFDKQVLRTLPYDMKECGGMDGFFAAFLKRRM